MRLRHNKTVNSIIITICAVFILGGAANNGFSSFLFAIPFVVIYVVQLKKFKQVQKLYLSVLLILLCFPVFIDKSHSTLFYPFLGSKVTFPKGWGYVQYTDSKNYSLIEPDSLKFYKNVRRRKFYTKPLQVFNQPTEMVMSEMNVSFADFGTTLFPLFADKSGHLYSISEQKLLKGIRQGIIKSDDLLGYESLQSNWTENLGMLMMWPMIPIILLSPNKL